MTIISSIIIIYSYTSSSRSIDQKPLLNPYSGLLPPLPPSLGADLSMQSAAAGMFGLGNAAAAAAAASTFGMYSMMANNSQQSVGNAVVTPPSLIHVYL